jgi:hypothetical protein
MHANAVAGIAPSPLQKLTMSNSPWDGLSASKTHPPCPHRAALEDAHDASMANP